MLLVPFFRGLPRHLLAAWLALTVTAAAAVAQTASSNAADGFDPNVDGNVFAMVAQPDGKIIIVGQFANVAPNGGISIARNNIARLNADGSLDADFDPNVNGAIRALIREPDGQIVIGGDFTQVGGQSRSGLARLNPNGSLDTSFTGEVLASEALPTKPQVLALALQQDGAIVVGGTFGRARAQGTTLVRNNLARFSAGGVVDATYNPDPNGMVLALALHVDGKMVVGGGFTAFRENGAEVTRLRVARLNPSGTLDSEFDPKANNGVTSIAIQPDGKILLGGYFTTLQPIGNENAESRSHLGRLNVDGTLDSEFFPRVSGDVFALAVSPDGGLLIGGSFSQIVGRGSVSVSQPFVARLTMEGAADQSFRPNVNATVAAFAFQPDGKVVIGGYFTRAQPTNFRTAVVRNHIARLMPSGALDAAFQLDPGGRILTSVTQADGKIVVGGTFTNIGGVSRNYLARLNEDGTVDPDYNPNLNAPVYALAYQSASNKVLIGGSFSTVGSDSRNQLARLNPNGTVDSEFNTRFDGTVGSIAVTNAGILVGGSFTAVQAFGDAEATARNNLVRLTDAGKIDAAFNPSPSSTVTDIAVQSDGKIIIVGAFQSVQPGATGTVHSRSHIARLNSDGSIDTNYNPNADPQGTISVVELQGDKAIVGGVFRGFFPTGATEVVEARNLARINADGSIDTSWMPQPNSNVLTLAVQGDKVLVGGTFTIMQPSGQDDWTQAKYIARVNNDGTVDTSFDLDLNERPGNQIDTITTTTGGDLLVGGIFESLQPKGTSARVLRDRFLRLTSAGQLVATFQPSVGGSSGATVRSIVVQTDGKLVVGGQFADLGGARSTNIARYHPEGAPDATFNSALSTNGSGINAIAVRANGVVEPTQLSGFAWLESTGGKRTTFAPTIRTQGTVSAAVVDNNGRLIVAGLFSDLSNTTTGNIARFQANGEIDANFNPSVGGQIFDLAIQSDNKIIIVGAFTSVNGQTRNRVARLNEDGTLDASFDPNMNSIVSTVLIEPAGTILLGGQFTTVQPNGATTAVTRNYLARVSTSGGLIDSFNPNLNGPVFDLAQAANERIIVGGGFSSLQPNSDTASTERKFIARLEKDGNVDKSFAPQPNDSVNSVAVEPDTQAVVFGGAFSSVNGEPRFGLARVSSDGTLDSSFNPTPNGPVTTLALSGSDVLFAGNFTTVSSSTPAGTTATEVARNRFARVNSAGQLDQSFNPDVAGSVSHVVVTNDGSILLGGSFSSFQVTGLLLVGGEFTNIGGVTLSNLAQINGDGSINAGFNPNPNGAVHALLPGTDGSFLIGGTFTTIAGAARTGIARFNNEGQLDTAFNPTITGGVMSLARQPDGKLLVGANSALGLIRLNADGSPDPTFTAGTAFAPAHAIAVQPNGRIVVAGPGSGVSTRVLRLNQDGSVDTSFTPQTADIRALTLQADGGIIVAGNFTSIGGVNAPNLARLQPNGTVDPTFNPAPNAAVTALALQADGRLMIGGQFTRLGNIARTGLARVANTAPGRQELSLNADGRTVTWIRRGTVGEVVGVTFEASTDGIAWTPLGNGTRVAGSSDWQLTNLTNLPGTTFFLRARGIVPTSAGKSTGVYEAVRIISPNSPVAGIAMPVATVTSGVPWDENHYVWTLDASGVLRIADAFSLTLLPPGDTVLIGGGSASPSGARLANLSTRGDVTATSPLIAGFANVGTAARAVLVRAVGPGLADFGVTNYLPSPELVLKNSEGVIVGTNAGWNDDPALSAVFARTGAFPLLPGSADCALVAVLEPGTYTVQVVDRGTSGGNALVEIYDAGDLADGAARLVNLSSRGTVSAQGSLIGGLVVTGTNSKTMLVRGVGPALTKFGVAGVLTNPKVAVYDGSGREIVSNLDWQIANQPTIPELDYGAGIASASQAVGAFAFDSGSKDAALIVTLAPGAYTVQVTGEGGTGGAALIEVYELP